MPGPYSWLDPAIEDQLWNEVEQRQIAQRAAMGATSYEQAQSAAGMSDAYPWLAPGVVQALTQAGLSASHPAVQSLATQAGRYEIQDGGFDTPADNTSDSFFDGLTDGINGAVGQGLNKIGRGFTNTLRAATAILAAPFEEVFERVIPAFYYAEQETDPYFGTPEGTTVPFFGKWNFQNLAASVSKPFQDEFWDHFWTGLTERASPSTLAMTVGDIAAGRDPKLFQFKEDYSGTAPDDIGLLGAFNRRQELRARIQIPEGDGTEQGTATLGRIVAREVVEPGSVPYQVSSGLVDFGANLLPTDLKGAQLVKGTAATMGLLSNRQILKLGGEAGLLPGLLRQVDTQDAVNSFVNGNAGQKLTSWLTETSSVSDIYRATGQADIGLAEALARNTDPAKTVEMLQSALGAGPIRGVPTGNALSRAAGSLAPGDFGDYSSVFGVGSGLRRSLRNVRFLQDVPGAKLNPHDLNSSAKEILLWANNARIGDDLVDGYLTRLASLESGDSVGLFNLAVDMGEDMVAKLVNQEGATRQAFTRNQARALTRMYRESNDEIRSYFVDELGRNVDILGANKITVNGETIAEPSTHLLSELVNNYVPLPGNARDVKKATSMLGRVWDIPGMRQSEAAADWFLHQLWKPAQLVTRFAYPVRVLGEEQLRMAGAGFDSMFNHPLSYIAWATGRKGSQDLGGNFFDEIQEFQAGLARGSGGWKGAPGEIFTGRYVRVGKGDSRYYAGAARELQMLSADPVAQRVAGGLRSGDARSIGLADDVDLRDLDNIKEWYWSGTGQKFRKELARAKGKGALADDDLARQQGYRNAREAADEYIDTYLRRIEIKTGGSADLIEAISRGKLGRHDMLKVGPNKIGSQLEEYADFLPEKVVAEETLRGKGSSMLDNVTSAMFNSLMTKPTNALSRSPFFRQAYYDEVERLIGFATKDAQLSTISRLGQAGFDSVWDDLTDTPLRARAGDAIFSEDEVTRLARAAEGTIGSQLTSWDEIDTLAKAFALDHTREMLYDLSKRNQFFDAARHLFPFGDAWKEIFTAWSKITKENPSMLRRFQQGVQGAMGAGFGELTSEFLGTGTQPGQGFVYDDPLTGELMFNYPGSELISDWMFGDNINVDFTGFVSGLNLFAASILPGVGPSVQVPVTAFTEALRIELPESLNNLINPFGEPDLSDPTSIITPAWFDKVRTALWDDPDVDRMYINLTMDVMRAMVRSGQGSTNTPEELNALVEEAQGKAQTLLLIRGLGQGVVPTGPSLRWDSADVQGNLLPVKLMSDHYRILVDKYNGDSEAALNEWLRLYGTENLLVLQGKTRSINYRPLTEEGHNWVQANPDIIEDYSLVGGMFAPDPVDGNFDYDAWNAQLNEGAREQLGPREMVMLSNNFIATQIYENAKSMVAGRTDAQAQLWLAGVQNQLKEEYPGFRDDLPIKGRPSTEDLIAEITRAVADPRLAETQTAEATRIYLDARAQAQAVVDDSDMRSTGFTRSQETQYLRDWLRTVGEELMVRYPEFRTVWDQIFSREIQESD